MLDIQKIMAHLCKTLSWLLLLPWNAFVLISGPLVFVKAVESDLLHPFKIGQSTKYLLIKCLMDCGTCLTDNIPLPVCTI